MLEQTSSGVDQLARLAMVSRALTESLRPSEVIDIVVRQGMAGLGAEGGVLALVAPDGVVVPVETVGYSKDAVAAFPRMSVEDDLPLTVAAREREPVWVASRGDAERRFPALLASAVSRSQAWAAIPLVADGLLIGCLGVSFLEPREFSEPERLFIRTLGNQCALALVAHRTQREASSATGAQTRSSRRPRAVRPPGTSIKTMVVQRSQHETPQIPRALRDDPRFTVTECDDHQALADLMLEAPFDLVVVAGDLRAASRIQIADMVRAQWPDAALAVLTGDPTVEEQARRLGADAVFGLAMPAGLLRGALATLVDGPTSTARWSAGSIAALAPTRRRLQEPSRGTSADAHSVSSAMFERSLDAVLFTAPDGQIIAANPAACHVLGMSEEDIRRRGRPGLADASDPRWAEGLKQRESTGSFFGELSMVRADGSCFPAEVSSAVFENEFGESRTVVVFRDVTERKLAHELEVQNWVDEADRDRIASILLEVAVRRLWAIGMSLQGGLEAGPGTLIDRATAAVDQLDDTIVALREALTAD
jgi:PAS domain S-box-containing protein